MAAPIAPIAAPPAAPAAIETRVQNTHRVQNCLDQILQNSRVGSSLFRRDFKVSNKCGELVADHCLELGLDVMSEAAEVAKLRNATQVEPVDVNFVLVRKYNIRVQPSISKLPRLVLHEESLNAGSDSLRHTNRSQPRQLTRDSYGNMLTTTGSYGGAGGPGGSGTHFTLGNEPTSLPTGDDGGGPKKKARGGRGKASSVGGTKGSNKDDEEKGEKEGEEEKAEGNKAPVKKGGRGKRKR